VYLGQDRRDRVEGGLGAVQPQHVQLVPDVVAELRGGQVEQLQASAYRATRRRVLSSPLPPMRIGGCGRCTEFGELSGRTSW